MGGPFKPGVGLSGAVPGVRQHRTRPCKLRKDGAPTLGWFS